VVLVHSQGSIWVVKSRDLETTKQNCKEMASTHSSVRLCFENDDWKLSLSDPHFAEEVIRLIQKIDEDENWGELMSWGQVISLLKGKSWKEMRLTSKGHTDEDEDEDEDADEYGNDDDMN
jgi:hypothetical protein